MPTSPVFRGLAVVLTSSLLACSDSGPCEAIAIAAMGLAIVDANTSASISNGLSVTVHPNGFGDDFVATPNGANYIAGRLYIYGAPGRYTVTAVATGYASSGPVAIDVPSTGSRCRQPITVVQTLRLQPAP
jgi:hypothetical protein